MKLLIPLLLGALLNQGSSLPEPGAAKADPKTSAVIDHVLEAYGGRDALKEVRAYRMEGLVKSSMENQEGEFVRLFQRPDGLMVSINYPKGPERRVLQGTAGWRMERSSGEIRPVEGFLLDSMLLQAARADIPWILDSKRAAARLSEIASPDGGSAMKFEVPLEKGLRLIIVVDPKSHLVVESQGVMPSSPMGPMSSGSFNTKYSDFRKVGKVLFPFLETNYAMGKPTGSTIIYRITLNPPMNDKDFTP